MKTWCPNR